jgi:spore germination protein GerM
MMSRQIRKLLSGVITGVALVSAIAAASGCAGSERVDSERAWASVTQASPTSARARSTRTTIYFLADEGAAPIGVRRTIPRTAPYAKGALRALLAGPSSAEAQRGLTTAIPGTAALRSFTIQNSTLAIVDLSGLRVSDNVIENTRVIFQIVRTLVGVSGIREVLIRSSGEPFGLPTVTQGIEDGPWGYSNMPMGPVCTGNRGKETVRANCFSPLP